MNIPWYLDAKTCFYLPSTQYSSRFQVDQFENHVVNLIFRMAEIDTSFDLSDISLSSILGE